MVESGVGESSAYAQWLGCQQDAVMKRINHAGHAGCTQRLPLRDRGNKTEQT